MRLGFYFPCCIARALEGMLRNRSRRRTCLFWSGILASLVTVFLVVALKDALLASSFICSTDDIMNNHIKVLCKGIAEQKKNHPLGGAASENKLCHELCGQDVSSQLACHTFHLNKPTVFTLDNGNKKVVKSVIWSEEREEAIDEPDEASEVYWNKKSGEPYFPTREELQSMAITYASNFIGHDINKDTIIKLMDENDLYKTDSEIVEYHKNFWLLLQDHEFLMSYLFEEFRLFPRVLGTCSSYYAVEYLKPLTENAMRPFSLTWRERLWKGLDILRYIRKLETVYMEHIHLCDIKHSHFGWNKSGNVMFLDLDSVLPENALLKIMENTPSCSEDEDCSYFDCKGRCHHRTSKCELERVNTNLQVVCDKVFLGNTDSVISLYGLLVSYEGNEELSEALELCKTNKGMTVDGMLDVLIRASNHLLY
ncbi:divergent protein kinase domain 1C-like [Penaeus japonicus]|uniref:divergent protein kinase domain 1C-like n=1 Tax=Penaeus japonicus TaxID=27405 RepID=UPI001C714818|nr:divergent protein kinase domain 1C-like [Penaeus japonicus]